MLSEPSHITFPTGEDGSDEAYALCYPPQHPGHQVAGNSDGDRDAPPLVVKDRVVPPEQAETLVAALVDNGTPYAYVEFPEERHSPVTAASTEADSPSSRLSQAL